MKVQSLKNRQGAEEEGGTGGGRRGGKEEGKQGKGNRKKIWRTS